MNHEQLLVQLHKAHTACIAAEKAYKARGTNKEDKTPWLVLLDTWRAAEKAEEALWREVDALLTSK